MILFEIFILKGAFAKKRKHDNSFYFKFSNFNKNLTFLEEDEIIGEEN